MQECAPLGPKPFSLTENHVRSGYRPDNRNVRRELTYFEKPEECGVMIHFSAILFLGLWRLFWETFSPM
jgi:hypothetical protein